MIVFPNAKINLGLRVLSKRKDGFHNLKSILYPIPLYDIIEIKESERDEFSFSGFIAEIVAEQNLVAQALFLLRRKAYIPGLKIHLHKEIPIGAGLGGGSSDAASILKSLNFKYNAGLSTSVLMELALELGSDVPFFINNKVVEAHGRGNEFKAIDLDLTGYYLFVVFPNLFISTRLAFQSLGSIRASYQGTQLNSFEFDGVNDFENSVFLKYPLLAGIKTQLIELGAVYASMSGSGSSIFGIFNYKPSFKFIENDYFCRLIKL